MLSIDTKNRQVKFTCNTYWRVFSDLCKEIKVDLVSVEDYSDGRHEIEVTNLSRKDCPIVFLRSTSVYLWNSGFATVVFEDSSFQAFLNLAKILSE